MEKKIIQLLFICYFFHELIIVSSALQVGFYAKKCRAAESIVQQEVQRSFSTDRSITAALLRMYFHDCFVRVRNNIVASVCHNYTRNFDLPIPALVQLIVYFLDWLIGNKYTCHKVF